MLSKAHAYFMIGLFQAVHSAEEIATHLFERFPVVTGAIHRTFEFFPILRMGVETFAVANVVIVACIIGLCPFVFQGKTWAMKLAAVIAAVEILNGFGHIGAALVTGAYYPGMAGAIGLVIGGVLFIKTKPDATE